ncbi:MAG TPA: VWA domain-containing protein [Clostridia bacterium]|nr:VWA domain-containing protein [Clostridia bacterium]
MLKRRYVFIVFILIVFLLLFVSCGKENEEISSTDSSETKTDIEVESLERGNEEDGSVTEETFEKSKFEIFLSENTETLSLEPIWRFKFGESTDWLEETPHIIPLINKASYDETDYQRNGYLDISYLDEYNLKKDRRIYGNYWSLKIPYEEALTEEENKQFIYDLAKYIEDKNSKIYKNFDDELIFSVVDESGDLWWGTVSQSYGYNTIEYKILKENIIKPDEEITIKPSEIDSYEYYLSMYHESNDYYLLDISCDEGDVYVNIETENNFGFYEKEYGESFTVEDYHGVRTINIGQLSQHKGVSHFRFDWDDSTKSVTFNLRTVEKDSKVNYGELLGAIKVSAEYASSITATPSKSSDAYVDIEHPDYKMDSSYLDKTPDGDYLLYVPSGFWDVRIKTKSGSIIPEYVTRNVPVNAGEVTLVEVPYPFEASIHLSDLVSSTSGIAIEGVQEDLDNRTVEMVFSLIDSSTQTIEPNLNNTNILEGGTLVNIKEIEKVQVPPSIVLLLDSSGSMRGEMDGTIKAAKKFIEGLPEDARLTIIDFDDKILSYNLDQKDKGLEVLDQVKVGGDTALYQSVLKGIESLQNQQRRTVVLFTDGENDLGGKEKYTKEEFFDLVSNEIPVITIGYGEGHDDETLKKLARETRGLYFSASDEIILEEVFQSINNRIGSTYKAIYDRPKTPSVSDIPIMTFMIDTSGSMGTEDGAQDSRINIVKNILYNFIINLEKNIQVQLMQFDDSASVIQTGTYAKEKILSGLSQLSGSGGTNIPNAIESARRIMDKIPSSQKLIVLVTDLTLDPEDEEIHKQLESLKKSGIKSLFVGIGEPDIEEDFKRSSSIAGGDYIVTTNATALLERFNTLALEIEAIESSDLSQVAIRVEKENKMGEREAFGNSTLVELSQKEEGVVVKTSNEIEYMIIKPLKQYDKTVAKEITGDSIPSEEVVVSNRMIVHKESKNEAIKLKVDELFFLEKLRSVSAPKGYRFLAVSLDLENILEPQEVIIDDGGSSHPANWVGGNDKIETEMRVPSYLIPNITNHFFVSVNEGGSYPGMKATGLLNNPLAYPGDVSVLVPPMDHKKGSLLFLIPDVAIDRLSLHLYDTNYETVNLPIIGKLLPEMTIVKDLPQENDEKLSETFDFIVTDISEPKIDKSIELTEKQGIRKISGGIQSNLYALLDLEPYRRFVLEFPTENGAFNVPLNPLTTTIPFGLYDKTMLAPGSYNRIALLFEVPKLLKDNASNLLIDLANEDVNISLTEGDKYPGTGKRYKGEYLDVTINQSVLLEAFDGYSGNILLIDATFHDHLDQYASSGVKDLIKVNQYVNEDEITTAYDFYYSDKYLLSLNNDSVIFDGENRRGLLFYELDDAMDYNETFIESNYFESMKIPIKKGSYNKLLAVKKIDYEKNDTFITELNEVLSKHVAYYEKNKIEGSEESNQEITSFSETSKESQDISMPSLTLSGSQIIDEIDSVEAMKKVLNNIRFLPSDNSWEAFNYMFSKEAMVSQGFGNENDMANMAIQVLSRLGYSPKKYQVNLTEIGQERLQEFSGSSIEVNNMMPAIGYEDKNENHLLVFPFMMDFKDLRHLVYIDEDQYINHEPKDVRLTIFAEVLKESHTRNAKMGDLSNALAGETSDEPSLETIELFSERMPLDQLSLDAVDIGFTRKGNSIKTFVDSPEGIILGNESVDLSESAIHRIGVEVYALMDSYTHYQKIDENMKPENLFITVSINSPNLTQEAYDLVQAQIDKVYNKVQEPSDYMSLQWNHRRLIYDLIIGQSFFEKELGQTMDILLGRSNEPRIILVSSKARSDQSIETTIDLMNINNTEHTEEEALMQSYNSLNGLYMTSLESDVLGSKGQGVFDLWQLTPKNTEFLLLDRSYEEGKINFLEEMGLSLELINFMRESNKIIMIPDRPAKINGEERWAWLTFDPYTYEVIGQMDTFENGAMVSNEIVGTIKNAGQYLIGNFVGVNTSVWSVAAHTLEGDDYEKVMKDAKAFALGLKDNFGVQSGVFNAPIGGKPEISQKIGSVKIKLDAKNPITQDVLGFTQGYVDGVNLYFDLAE